MTIKEVENLLSIPRATIRFYENEGLIHPQRSENGYRQYREEDVAALKKIQLLRSMEISIEQIRSMEEGRAELSQVLQENLKLVEEKRADLSQAIETMKRMLQDQVSYRQIKGDSYSRMIPEEKKKAIPEIKEASGMCPGFFRRFFARSLDMSVFSLPVMAFLILVFRVNPNGMPRLITTSIVPLLSTMFLEPLCLMLFTTTLGKWILGIQVTNNEGGHLTYRQGLKRTWQVYLYGFGLYIPLFSLYRLYKTAKQCFNGEELEWEWDSMEEEKQIRRSLVYGKASEWTGPEGKEKAEKAHLLRTIGQSLAYLIALILIVTSERVIPIQASRPIHSGMLTVEQFCDNYNRLCDFYGLEPLEDLGKDGKWHDVKPANGVIIIEVAGPKHLNHTIEFETRGDMLTGVKLIQQGENFLPLTASSLNSKMLISTLAFCGARMSFKEYFELQHNLTGFESADFQSEMDIQIPGFDTQYQTKVQNFEKRNTPRGILYEPTNYSQNSITITWNLTLL